MKRAAVSLSERLDAQLTERVGGKPGIEVIGQQGAVEEMQDGEGEV